MPQKILIVDDRQENLYALHRVLREIDVELVDACNGNDALTATLHHDFALAILDVHMPGMDGYELASLLRGDVRTHSLPIIFMTAAYGEEEHIFKGYESGAVDYIIKPYEPRVLLSKVRVFLELHSANMALAEKVEALAASEERFRSLVMTIPDIVYRVDPEGRFTFLNDAVRTLGYLPEDLIGTHFSRIMQSAEAEAISRASALSSQVDDAATRAVQFDEHGLGKRMTTELEMHLLPRFADGAQAVTVEVSSSGLYSMPAGKGKPVFLGTVGVIRDISERKRAQVELQRSQEHLEDLVRERTAELEQHRLHLEDLVEQRTADLLKTEAQARHILQSSADGLYGIDAHCLITFINPAACTLLGYFPEQVVGRNAHELFHHSKSDGSAYPIEECPTCRALQDAEEVRVDDEVYWHADGHPVPVMFAAHPMLIGGRIAGAVISFVDMSEQRAATRARELAISAAENLARLRSEFLANMSHEIRTPLNGVLGFAAIGVRNYQNEDKALKAFNQILASGQRLLGVINDILDFSKIEAGKLKVEQTQVILAEVISQSIDLVGERAKAKHIALLVKLARDVPESFIGDPLRLGQIILNLLTNAIKFTEAGSVTLSVIRLGEQLVFKVADTGIGMNAEQLAQLFNPFQQADGSITRRFGGTGLGLAITRRILELMGGNIRVESQSGVGSVFEFQVPFIQADAPLRMEMPTDIIPEMPLAGLSILVAEDEPINQAVLEELLSESGAQVVMVSNGREALDRVIQMRNALDIALLDVQMPEMDGYEATRRILALNLDLPIIGQTAHALPEEKAKCLEAGMVDHIAKPLDPDALVQIVLKHTAGKVKHR